MNFNFCLFYALFPGFFPIELADVDGRPSQTVSAPIVGKNEVIANYGHQKPSEKQQHKSIHCGQCQVVLIGRREEAWSGPGQRKSNEQKEWQQKDNGVEWRRLWPRAASGGSLRKGKGQKLLARLAISSTASAALILADHEPKTIRETTDG